MDFFRIYIAVVDPENVTKNGWSAGIRLPNISFCFIEYNSQKDYFLASSSSQQFLITKIGFACNSVRIPALLEKYILQKFHFCFIILLCLLNKIRTFFQQNPDVE